MSGRGPQRYWTAWHSRSRKMDPATCGVWLCLKAPRYLEGKHQPATRGCGRFNTYRARQKRGVGIYADVRCKWCNRRVRFMMNRADSLVDGRGRCRPVKWLPMPNASNAELNMRMEALNRQRSRVHWDGYITAGELQGLELDSKRHQYEGVECDPPEGEEDERK